MLPATGNRGFSVSDFPVARFGSLLAPGVRWRPIPISEPTYQTGVYVEVEARDRSGAIEWTSVQVKNILTRQADTARFSFKKRSDDDFDVNVGDEIKVYDTGSLIFRGVVLRSEHIHVTAALVRVQVEAIDFTYELDGKAVAASFTSQSARSIIETIFTRYAPQFTLNNVYAPQTISYINFAYQSLSSCLQELSDMLGYDWYVDENKDLHFGPSESDSAPYEVTDTDGIYLAGSLNFKDDISQIRNVIYVRGGEEIGSSQTFSESADGVKLNYPCGYHFSEKPTVTVAAVSKTVGIEGVDDPASFTCLWNPTRDYILFRAATIPTVGQQVNITGTPLNPILLKLPDRGSVAEHGERFLSVVDSTIITRAGARQRAMAELLRYAQTLRSGSFSTLTKGYRAGQLLTINSTLFGVNAEYVVTEVHTRMRSPDTYQYEVVFVSTKLMDIVDMLVKVLRAKNKDQAFVTTDSFDPAEFVPEEATVAETVTSSTSHNQQTETATITESASLPGGTGLDYGTIFVYGPYPPATTKRQFNLERSPLG